MPIPMSNMVLDLIIKDTNELLVIDFYADWCGPCKILSKNIDEYINTNTNIEFKLIKINVDENSEISDRFNISSLPTLLFFKNGELKNRLEGNNFNVFLNTIHHLTRQ